MSAKSWSEAGVEPAVEELLSDPIVLLIMKRDGLSVGDVRRSIGAAHGGPVGSPAQRLVAMAAA